MANKVHSSPENQQPNNGLLPSKKRQRGTQHKSEGAPRKLKGKCVKLVKLFMYLCVDEHRIHEQLDFFNFQQVFVF